MRRFVDILLIVFLCAAATIFGRVAHAGPPVIWSGDGVKILKNKLYLADGTAVINGTQGAYLGPAGMVFMTASTSCPTGSLHADGSAISRSTYATLFAAVSTTYGTGDGSTTFNLPNTKGVFVRGAGSQTISTISYTGTQGTTEGDRMQGHYHGVTDPGHLHGLGTSASGAGTSRVGNFGSNDLGQMSTLSATTGITIGAASTDGSNGTPRVAAETRPANISLKYCIVY